MTRQIDPLQNYAARERQSLGDHLEGVAENVQRLLPEDGTTAYGDEWQTVGQAMAWTHDAGKLTEYFQTYLETGDRTIAARPEYTYHGFVSSLLTAHVLHRMDVAPETRLAGFYAVAKHHGVIPTLSTEHPTYCSSAPKHESKYDIAGIQLQNIDQQARSAANEILQTASKSQLSWGEIYADDPATYKQLLKADITAFDDQFYETVLRAWSTLVCADKLDAANIEVEKTPTRPELSTLRSRINALPDGETDLMRGLNDLRSSAHTEATERLRERHATGDRFFRLTLPTGFGKTLTGLHAGLELAEQEDSRLIYALPYTSILDQVDDVCQQFMDVSPTDPAYTIHHHLADTRTDLSGMQNVDAVSNGSETLYAETWQSGLVLTTFTQLFESLAGPANTQSMKLPALQDSVIVVDEPQGISIDWWDLVSRLTKFVTREYNTTVVLMTATQPKILEATPDLENPTALTSQTAACTDFLTANPRVTFEIHDSLARYLSTTSDSSPLELDTAAGELRKNTPAGSNTLAIVNTIESAATLTEELHDHVGSDDCLPLGSDLCAFLQDYEGTIDEEPTTVAGEYLEAIADRRPVDETTTVLATLTTRLRPRDRGILLAALRQILDEDTTTPFDACPTISVSTQLIEAGVDVSFDRLYRDFAPVPALVQAAGRCNREYQGVVSTVTVWRLAAPEPTGPVPSDLIYGQKALLRPTRTALETLQADDGTTISEAAMISTGVERYYDALHNQRDTEQRQDDLTKSFNTGDGERLRKASLIEQDYATQDVLVLVSEADAAQYNQYATFKERANWTKAKQAFTDLQSLMVTVPIDREQAPDDPTLKIADLTAGVDAYEVATGRGISLDDMAMNIER